MNKLRMVGDWKSMYMQLQATISAIMSQLWYSFLINIKIQNFDTPYIDKNQLIYQTLTKREFAIVFLFFYFKAC